MYYSLGKCARWLIPMQRRYLSMETLPHQVSSKVPLGSEQLRVGTSEKWVYFAELL